MYFFSTADIIIENTLTNNLLPKFFNTMEGVGGRGVCIYVCNK